MLAITAVLDVVFHATVNFHFGRKRNDISVATHA